MSIYHFSATTITGQEQPLGEYKGKVVLIVNTAGQCGFAYQYADLQRLYNRYKERDLVILGFPCNQFGYQEPDSNEQIQQNCLINYGVTFPLFQKVNVRDEDAHPLFDYLSRKKKFEGFPMSHSVAKLVMPLIHQHHPTYLEDNYSIKWNFTKFLVDTSGNVVKRFECAFDPIDIEQEIEALLPVR